MAGLNITPELNAELKKAESIEQMKDLLVRSGQEVNAQEAARIWTEIEYHRVDFNRPTSMQELENVSGGRDPEYCEATVEDWSWCWSNDLCCIWDNVYP